MAWTTTYDIMIDEFPGVMFSWTWERVMAGNQDIGVRELFGGWPVWNVFFADLNGDGFPELVATVSFGSGIIDTRIIVYDFASNRSYVLQDRAVYDYVLSLEDGRLVVSQMGYGSTDILAVGELAIINDELFVFGIDRATHQYEPYDETSSDIDYETNVFDNGLGIVMHVHDISASGLSFSFQNLTNSRFAYSPHYSLYVLNDGVWGLVEPIIEDWNWIFHDVAYSILPNTTSDPIELDWRWNLGELPDGHYKFQKQIMYWRSPGDFDTFILENEFILRSSNETANALNYAEFLRVLTLNEFEFESENYYVRSSTSENLRTGHKSIYIDDERIIVLNAAVAQFDSITPPMVQITWQPSALWSTADYTFTVVYSGDDERIVAFLSDVFSR